MKLTKERNDLVAIRGMCVTFLNLLPVVEPLVLRLVVVEGVHIHLFRVVPRKDLPYQEAIRQINLGVPDREGQVEGVEPTQDLAG